MDERMSKDEEIFALITEYEFIEKILRQYPLLDIKEFKELLPEFMEDELSDTEWLIDSIEDLLTEVDGEEYLSEIIQRLEGIIIDLILPDEERELAKRHFFFNGFTLDVIVTPEKLYIRREYSSLSVNSSSYIGGGGLSVN